MPQEVNSRLLLTLGTIENENPERITVLLDIAAQLKRVTIMDQDRLSKLLDQAHEDIEEVFESCLTDTLREQFDTEV
jgi:uncharacterized protein (TIGR04255 family)